MGSLKPIAVVFDLNIYLDIARLLDQPYAEAKLHSAILDHRPNTERSNRQMEAGKAVAMCSTGNLSGAQRLQVWSSSWIERGVENVAKRSVVEKGLGWSAQNAAALRTDLITTTAVGRSNGSSLQTVRGISYNGLSPDDSAVFHTASQALALCSRSFCVTSDQDFRDKAPRSGVQMLSPGQLVDLIRQARAS